MRKSLAVWVVAAIVLSAPFAWAQRPRGGGGFGGGVGWLAQQSVQQELKLSQEQTKQVDELLAAQRESFSGLRDLSREERQVKLAEANKAAETKLGSILNEEQLKRFKQIALQQRGAQALADPEIATALALTDEQKSKIGEIQSAAREETRGLFQGAAGGDREELRKKFEEARTATNEKLMGVLTSEQQAKWKELTGEPFKGAIRRGFRGPRGDGEGDRPRRNRAAPDSASARTPRTELTSFREEAGSDDDADKSDAKSDKADAKRDKADAKKKTKGEAKKKAKRSAPHKATARTSRSDRDRAWSRVARSMRHRGPMQAHRGSGRHFVHGPRRGHHGPAMAHRTYDSRVAFGPAGYHHRRFARGGFHGAGQRFWFARYPEFRFAHRWHGHHGFRPPMGYHGPRHGAFAARHHHHGPRAHFAGHHHGRRPMHMSSFKRHHGPDEHSKMPKRDDDRRRERRSDDRERARGD